MSSRLKYIYTIVLILPFMILIFAYSALADSDLGPRKDIFKVEKITVKGLKKVEKEAILERISTKVGMTLDNYLLRKDLSKIYDLKYFDFVEAHTDDKGTLSFLVKEKPIITTIEIKGNDEIDDDDLLSQIKVKKFSILDINTIKNDIKALQKFYEEKGYYLASVDYRIKSMANENVALEFYVKEFDKVRVKKNRVSWQHCV